MKLKRSRHIFSRYTFPGAQLAIIPFPLGLKSTSEKFETSAWNWSCINLWLQHPREMHDFARRFSGIVRSWNPDGGFGFIVCSESRAIYNKDRLCPGLTFGRLLCHMRRTYFCTSLRLATSQTSTSCVGGLTKPWKVYDLSMIFLKCTYTRLGKYPWLSKQDPSRNSGSVAMLCCRLEFRDGEPVSFQVEYDDKLKPRARIILAVRWGLLKSMSIVNILLCFYCVLQPVILQKGLFPALKPPIVCTYSLSLANIIYTWSEVV